ncbi:MAG TPA: hypothetical protein VMZ73_09115 [Acidimicrobiales bacterium]|nr:hypothetical protein [Acidimicrobiales bacterium]
MRLSDLIDLAAIAAVAAGLGAHFGWWLAAVVAGALVLAANYARSSS